MCHAAGAGLNSVYADTYMRDGWKFQMAHACVTERCQSNAAQVTSQLNALTNVTTVTHLYYTPGFLAASAACQCLGSRRLARRAGGSVQNGVGGRCTSPSGPLALIDGQQRTMQSGDSGAPAGNGRLVAGTGGSRTQCYQMPHLECRIFEITVLRLRNIHTCVLRNMLYLRRN